MTARHGRGAAPGRIRSVAPGAPAGPPGAPRRVPPAPATFSAITGWPSDALMRSPTMRAVMSVTPPAEKGTISLMGREGYASAPALPTAVELAANAIARSSFLIADLRTFPAETPVLVR